MFQTLSDENVLGRDVDQRYTSNQVIELTGITARQLQWWDERGLVVPVKDGHRRLYSIDDLAEIAVICDLRRRGFSLQRVRKVVKFLRKEFGKRLVDTAGRTDCHLLTDGSRIYVKTSAQQAIDVLKNARQPMFTVCLSDTVREICAGLPRKTVRNALAAGKSRRRA